ncbi:extracellular solute-binding protein [Paenibacillus mesophilus]|uniref:ABC transporter substrate-binding protein n=1 Tax=Paenibacillus mesophilus TaxID=2582849 RepID=UPI00110DDD76|nr:extracellular solute-binding protein [Paenibacillus mesophilus]TMV43508.1 extracellular solute-binding protein [Paenibacillus mesophilus]
MGKANRLWGKGARIAFAAAAVVALSACGAGLGGGTAAEGEPPAKKKEPFTLKIWGGGVTVKEFEERFRKMLTQHFPHITVEYILSGKGTTMPELVAAGEIPDIIRFAIPDMSTNYLDLKLGYDLNPHVKESGYDLARFVQIFTDEVRDAGRSEALYGLPIPPYFPQVLYFNKDLFDKFGVGYPQDGMTWDDLYEMARKMTRTEGGVNYRGFSSNLVNTLRDNQYSLPILDPAADRLADSNKWQQLFVNLKRFYDIPGNTIEANNTAESAAFSKGHVALMPNQHSVYLTIPVEVNWDIVSYPTLPGAPKLAPQRGPAYLGISNTSKHKAEAFEVIVAMLSDEMQLADSKRGITTTLNNNEIAGVLGTGDPVYSTKHMAAVNYYPPTPYTQKRKADLTDVPGAFQQNLIASTFIAFAQGKADLNTTLRQLEEQLRAEVEKEKNK